MLVWGTLHFPTYPYHAQLITWTQLFYGRKEKLDLFPGIGSGFHLV